MKYESLKKKLSHIALECNKEYELHLQDLDWIGKGFISEIEVGECSNKIGRPIEVRITLQLIGPQK